MSSPVFATTATRSGATASAMPRASLAPPVPPARTTTSSALTSTQSLPHGIRQPRQADSRVGLVAGVDGDQQRGQRLGYARHLQAPAVDAAHALDQAQQPCRPELVGARIAAQQHVLFERVREVASDAALTVCSAETTRTPSGAISRACSAAEPCQTPSVRVALPPTAAASGTVASISSWPGASAWARLCSVSAWLRKGTLR